MTNQTYFEDIVPGTVGQFGSIEVSQADIIEFARKFDPQYFHLLQRSPEVIHLCS
ncbi:MAG: hypothetical protein DIJKHBIC_02127 [Thermoanaerobaculia bacterium]|nr:hypothetical protein [Thermoanaerobaculia bacterium]